jgi:hypothetical protein
VEILSRVDIFDENKKQNLRTINGVNKIRANFKNRNK